MAKDTREALRRETEVHVKKPDQTGNGKTAIEGKATDGQDAMRVPKGLDRLLWHCELVDWMTALPERDQAPGSDSRASSGPSSRTGWSPGSSSPAEQRAR